MSWYKYLIQFIIGGIIIAGTGYLAENFSTKVAALFWALPITLLPILIFAYYESKTPEITIRNFLFNNIPTVCILLLWIISLYFLLSYFHFWQAMGFSCIFFTVFASIYWMIFCPSPFKKGSCIKSK